MNQSFLKDAPLVEIENFKKWILHEDENLLVIDKPGWLVCHPSKNGPFSSLVGTAKEYLKTQTLHLVSRLDRETSGVVMLAKNRKAAGYWQKGVERKTAPLPGNILEGVIDEPQKVATFLGKDPLSAVYVKQRVTKNSRKAKYAETDFISLQCQGGYTLCSIATLTGRKHQIVYMLNQLGVLWLVKSFMARMKAYTSIFVLVAGEKSGMKCLVCTGRHFMGDASLI